MNIDDTMIAAPAPTNQSSRNAPREATVSSRNQKADSMPPETPDIKVMTREAFRQLPVTLNGEQPTTIVSKSERPEPEPIKADMQVRETNKQKSERPDPRVSERMDRKKSAEDVWSRLPAEVNPEVKPAEAVPAEVVSADAQQALQEDPYANIKTNDWKALKDAARTREAEAKKQAAEYQAKLDKAEADLAKYRTNIPNPEDAEKIKAENKAALDRLALLDWKSHPQYQREFVEPKQKLGEKIKGLLSDNGIEGVDIEGLLNKPRIERAKAISEIQDKMNRYDADDFRASVREMEKVHADGQASVGTHQQMAEGLKHQSEMRARQAFENAIQENKSWILNPYKIEPGESPEEAVKLDAFNKSLSQIRSNAERYAFSPSDEKTSGAIAFKAAQYDFYTQHALPRMVKDYQSAKETIAELSNQLKDLQAKRPGTHDATSSPAAPDKKDATNKTFREQAADLWKR